MTTKNNKEINSQNESLKLKIEFLNKKLEDTHTFFKHTLSAITVIFIFVGIIITVLSISSKTEINNAIDRMERKFEILSGQAIKKTKTFDFLYR